MRYRFFKTKIIFNVLGFAIFFWILMVCSCQSRQDSKVNSQKTFSKINISSSSVHQAVGFDLVDYGQFKVLHLLRHYNESSDTLSYVLHEKGVKIPEEFSTLKHIETPVMRVALLHSSYLPFFQLCETMDHIKAISEVKYVYDDGVYSSVKSGALQEVGFGETLDKEKLLELEIDMVITVGFPNTPNKSQQVLEELEIPVLVFSEWQESTPLGRAEWVKIIAALTGADERCNEKFIQIENQYQRLKSLTKALDSHPSVICNLPYKGAWYVPGGNSYMANVLKDAGADYLWSEEEGTGGLQIDFEAVYAKGLKADFWINTDLASRREEIIEKDERLKDFHPIETGSIYNNNNRMSRGVANDYWESAIINPQIVLSDLIRIFHPELLPEHQLFYYKQVE